MRASEAVRQALTVAAEADTEVVGTAVVQGPRGAPVLPRIEIGEPVETDWSAKGMRGRELRTATTVRVAEGQAGRLGALVAAVERAGESLAGDIGGWRVAGTLFLRSRGVAEKGVRAVLVEHRVRVVEE